MASKLFVGNLDFRTSSEEISELFVQVGPIKEVFLPLDRETRRPRGFAFVEYESEEDAEKAIAKFNGHELGGRPLRVNAAEERPRTGGGSFGGGGRPSFSPSGGGGGFGPDAPPAGRLRRQAQGQPPQPARQEARLLVAIPKKARGF
jgi:RNA recognition motif-containing protein